MMYVLFDMKVLEQSNAGNSGIHRFSAAIVSVAPFAAESGGAGIATFSTNIMAPDFHVGSLNLNIKRETPCEER